MLFIEGKVSEQVIEGAARLALLEKLQDKELTPVIRAARLSCYEQALLGHERVPEMERSVATWTEMEDGSPYVRGDLFCYEDYALFLIFGETEGAVGGGGLRAGIVYEAETTEPLKKLDAFCRQVGEAMEAVRSAGKVELKGEGAIEWRPREPVGFAATEQFMTATQFTTAAEAVGPMPSGQEVKGEQSRALELLEDAGARRFLHRLRDAHPGGRVAELLTGQEGEAESESLLNRLSGVGLLRREMLVSCRKVGRPLFRLPSPEALSVITASNAICSECGASIADEKIEDFIKPTETAATLLEDGSWLIKRAYAVLRELGLAERDVAVGRTEAEGEGQLMVRVCHEPFLLVLRDGDVTLAHARHACDRLMETRSTHLVLVTTGEVQDEARVRLREHARRRARSGSEIEVILVEGLETMAAELRQAFERVSQRAVVEELCELDASLGLSVGQIVNTRFRLMRSRSGALKDLAESAVGALAGSLRDIQ